MNTPAATPSAAKIAQVLASPCTSYWLADALRSALDRDPVDAARDAETLAYLLSSHARSLEL